MVSEKQAQLSDVLQQLEERSAVICLVLVRCPGHYVEKMSLRKEYSTGGR